MSKKQGLYIGALKTTVANLEADKRALTEALENLGYCHEQQTKFITEASSGPNGAISQGLLLQEAITTNKRLTEEREYQDHRYTLLQERNGQQCRTIKKNGEVIEDLEDRLSSAHKAIWSMVGMLFVASVATAAYHLSVLA